MWESWGTAFSISICRSRQTPRRFTFSARLPAPPRYKNRKSGACCSGTGREEHFGTGCALRSSCSRRLPKAAQPPLHFLRENWDQFPQNPNQSLWHASISPRANERKASLYGAIRNATRIAAPPTLRSRFRLGSLTLWDQLPPSFLDLELKSTQDCNAFRSEWIQRETKGRTKRAAPPEARTFAHFS